MIEVRRKEGEPANALLFRFSKRVKRSGILKEANKRRFYHRITNSRHRKLSALHREGRRKEVERLRKLGLL